MITWETLNTRAKVVLVFSTIAFASAVWAAVHFIHVQNTAVDIPRMFLRLERAIGYDGFIHNFKNYVLRNDGRRYLERAKNDYREAQEVLNTIRSIGHSFGVDASLAPVELTLNEYYDKLLTAEKAKANGLNPIETDALVKVSDVRAGSAIRNYQREIEALITKRHHWYFWGLLLNFIVLTLTLVALFFTQLYRISQANAYSASLRQKKKQLRRAESLAQLGRWKSDAKGRLTCSKFTMRMFEIAENNLGSTTKDAHMSQKYFWSHVHPEDRQKLKIAIQQAQRGNGTFTCVHRLIRTKGRDLTICNSGKAMYDRKGNITGYTGTFQDITHVVEMEGRLRQAKQMEIMGKLSGGLAHDFNNLLAIIQANIQLTLNTKLPEASAKNLNSAMQAINRGSELTKSMLSYARKSPMRRTQLNLNQLVRENIGWSTRLLPENIQMTQMLCADLWDVHTDANLTQSAVFNLVMNAKDAMPKGGTVTIKTENVEIDRNTAQPRQQALELGKYVVLSVSDTGPGIPQSILSKIFDPFYTTDDKGIRSGLGLSMVVGFMEQTGGAVDVVTQPQLGTTFKLYFKASESKREALIHSQNVSHNLIQKIRV